MELNLKKVETAMADLGWGAVDLARALGMRTESLRRIRTSKALKPQTVGKIAKALGVKAEEIVA
jgi:DNA-binding Xre family transcriptional regulator